MMMKIVSGMGLASLLLLGSCAAPRGYDVYLLIGQSNMAGRGRMIASDHAPMKGVYLLDDSARAVAATAPFNQYSSIRKELWMQQVSPANSFANILHARTGKRILLVVNARGGSSIREWSPSRKDNYSDKAIARTRQALKYGKLKGILWHQGESDAKNPSGYMDSLQTMVHHLRTELHEPRVPFVAGEIAQWHYNKEIFNRNLHQIGRLIPHSDWVSSEGCSCLKDETDPHFSRDGQMLLGERYAEKILKMVYNK